MGYAEPPARRDCNLTVAPDELHERVAAGDGRVVKVDWYRSGASVRLGLVYPDHSKAKATARLTVAEARELIAALETACDAIAESIDAYHAAAGQ